MFSGAAGSSKKRKMFLSIRLIDQFCRRRIILIVTWEEIHNSSTVQIKTCVELEVGQWNGIIFIELLTTYDFLISIHEPYVDS